jgi:putative heme-binding domain-containing protein
VRLVDALSGELFISTAAPRNDLAQPVEWDLQEFAERQGRIEVVDADEGGGYAWIAAGRFDPPVVPLPAVSPGDTSARLQAVAGVIAGLQLKSQQPRLERLLPDRTLDLAARGAVAAALVTLNFDNLLAALVPFVGDSAIDGELRDRVALAIVSRDPVLVGKLLIDIVRTAPERKQLTLAETLAGDRSGAEELLRLVAAGHASPRLLQRQTVREKLLALRDETLLARADELTAGLPSENETIRKLIAERVAAHRTAARSAANGSAAFAKHCANCHQLDGKGPLIGPQLDGIGNRGMERLVEDVLDPNRNVDVAFCVSTLVLDSGKVLAGLVRREEGATLVLADNKGQEVSIPLDEIEERTKTRLSLMPENVAELISEQEFHDLIAFLLQKTAKPSGDEAQ